MATQFEYEIPAHANVYTNTPRTNKVYFSTPSQGVNKDTGLLLLIPGYGGHSQSNVYRKMRRTFADDYNLICIQCDYFGQEFMQNEVLEESVENFNDMSFMQAIDNINAVLFVIEALQRKNFSINYGKVIVYGQSHGAYLSYVCNAFSPNLFTMLIDNSSYLYPLYLVSERNLKYPDRQVTFHYLASDFPKENEIFYLPSLYSKFENQCKIISYNGTHDLMVPQESKEKFCRGIHPSYFELVSVDRVDGGLFKSTQHGLGADFLRLFEYTMDKYGQFEVRNRLDLCTLQIRTSEHQFELNYDRGRLQFSALIL
ncbi:DUF2920 family protein [Paenibacillus thiaminolyticus]|uniref:DUF2920 family protein n=1 Tax=Paenibacillus thiaminolyticus TaxID=49283 RepID=A0A3A3H177_PANTH|nr:DUF2920 family protein [Paenibacillus thiaminolyticus]RJG24821.1 DUF2920 family protein [Paenibacillus thiaminolyticus]